MPEKWQPLLWICGLMLLLQLIGPEYLRYDKLLILQGQIWRWLSAHLVHANWMHLALNVAGFVLCVGITSVHWRFWQWIWRIVMLAFSISAGLFFQHPEMGWYVGFSGVLFGLYLLAADATRAQQPLISSLLAVFIVAKIVIEQSASVNITSSELIGVPVMVDAHLYGVSAAIALIALQYLISILKQD